MGIYKLWSRGLPFIMLDKDTDIIFMADDITFEAVSDKDAMRIAGALVERGGEDMSCTVFKKKKAASWQTLSYCLDYKMATKDEK